MIDPLAPAPAPALTDRQAAWWAALTDPRTASVFRGAGLLAVWRAVLGGDEDAALSLLGLPERIARAQESVESARAELRWAQERVQERTAHLAYLCAIPGAPQIVAADPDPDPEETR